MTWERIGLAIMVWMLLNALCCVMLARPTRYDENNLTSKDEEK
jgi:hypothetical protein